jgi:hypothetical protein
MKAMVGKNDPINSLVAFLEEIVAPYTGTISML